MQCKDRNYIYTIDKKLIAQNLDELKDILNIQVIEIIGRGKIDKIYTDRDREAGIEKYFKGKEWVFFNRKPGINGKNKILARQLYERGYFKYTETGCGKCEICRTEKSKEWATKAHCENLCWKDSCFITLTYNNQGLPDDRKLRRSDIQGFWKRLRYHCTGTQEIPSNILEDMFGMNSRRKNRKPIRYINCGEYGPQTKRPHYHAVVFNFRPTDLRRHSRDRRGYWIYTSKQLNEIWGKGYVIIGNSTTETAAYVARYTTKKYSRTTEEEEKMKKKKQNEFIGASSLGFIGYYYWMEHKDTIKRNGGIVIANKKGTYLAKIPKAMEKKWKWEDEDEYEEYDYWKCETGKKNWEKILAGTTLTEKEYIEDTWRARMKKLAKLTRNGTETITTGA